MTYKELAAQINRHLKRFEADPKVNVPRESGGLKTLPYFHAQASAGRSGIYVTYIAYQGRTKLDKAEAEAYLNKLDTGFVGRHFEALP